MPSVAKDGLHFEYVRPTVSKPAVVPCKIGKLIMVCSPCGNSLDLLLLVFLEHFECERRYVIII